jgi:ABC-2 type transport system permease protein
VRDGNVAYELCRPVDLYALWFARAVAQRTAPTLLRAVPMLIFAVVVLPLVGLDEWQLGPPASPMAAVGFAAALLGAIALACAITTLINVSLLWTIGGDGVVAVAGTFVAFCSGMIVPLPLFPDWLRDVLTWLPFAGLVDLPYRIYNGGIPAGEIALVLARQVGWVIVLVMLGRLFLARSLRRIAVQGG